MPVLSSIVHPAFILLVDCPKVSIYMYMHVVWCCVYSHSCVRFCSPQPPVTMKQDPVYAELSHYLDGPAPPPPTEIPVQFATMSTHINNVEVRMYMYRLCIYIIIVWASLSEPYTDK